ncbi:unnamed protein product [Aphis gossypii]|uniref:Uncharacterized protein n=1 Tax=Aphis gossypii TaxID=80765 RepID=A0A9P0IUU5_APHGO|nr:unnamed protein product [Aphis gossypii]
MPPPPPLPPSSPHRHRRHSTPSSSAIDSTCSGVAGEVVAESGVRIVRCNGGPRTYIRLARSEGRERRATAMATGHDISSAVNQHTHARTSAREFRFANVFSAIRTTAVDAGTEVDCSRRCFAKLTNELGKDVNSLRQFSYYLHELTNFTSRVLDICSRFKYITKRRQLIAKCNSRSSTEIHDIYRYLSSVYSVCFRSRPSTHTVENRR